MSEERTKLSLKKDPPDRLRFIERKTRYILQEKRVEFSGSHTVSVVWRDVPLVKL